MRRKWTAEFVPDGGYDSMTHAWVILADQRCIAKLDLSDYGQQKCDDGFRSPEAETTARVLSAALDLRNALKALKGECFCDCGIGNPMFPDHTKACVAATAALAKAEGREHR